MQRDAIINMANENGVEVIIMVVAQKITAVIEAMPIFDNAHASTAQTVMLSNAIFGTRNIVMPKAVATPLPPFPK